MREFACRFCGHSLTYHDRLVGCQACTCMASPGEANPQTPEDLDAPVLAAGLFRGTHGPYDPRARRGDIIEVLTLLRELNTIRKIQWVADGDELVARVPVDAADLKVIDDFRRLLG